MAVTTFGFTTEALIKRLYGNLGLTNILSDVTGTDEDNVIDQFIRDAEQTVWVRLSRFFDSDDMVGNQWIESTTTWIAAYYLSQRKGNEHYFESGYQRSMTELDAMATGELPPEIGIPLKDYSYPSMSNLIISDWYGVQKVRVRPDISVGGNYADQHTDHGFLWGWV